MNHDSFRKLITEYLLNGSNMQDDLKQDFEEHFMTCQECWEALEVQKAMLGVLEEEADQIFSEVEIEEIIDKAEVYGLQGNFSEAIKCLKEALEAKPGNKLIENKIKELIQKKSRKKSLAVMIGKVEQNINWVNDKAEIIISRPSKVEIKLGDILLINQVFESKDFKAVHITSSKYKDRPHVGRPKNLLVDKEGIRIEIEKGPSDGKFIITRAKD